MKYAWLLAVPAGILLLSSQSSPDAFVSQVQQQLTRFYQVTAPEKVYLHFDKDTYAAGETMWFKAYVVDAARHRPDSLSQVVYVDLLDANQRILGHQTLALKEGGAPGDFALPLALAQGTYSVRAYTNWQRNTPEFMFTRAFTVWSEKQAESGSTMPVPATDQPDVQFFPEGGQLVAGVRSVVGIKALGTNGRGLDVQGQVVDEQGVVVAQFNSYHLGMGRFEIQPVAGHRYTARVRPTTGGPELSYALPAVQPTGLALQVQDLGDAYGLTVQRRSTAATPPETMTVVAHVRGQIAYLQQGEVRDDIPLAIRISKSKCAAGIVHFTVFDSQRAARCERLTFADTAPGLHLVLEPSKKRYAPREQVTLRVRAQDAQGRPAASRFSLAVTNAALAPLLTEAPNIRTSLLLTSDLRGQVEQPGYYFQTPSAATARALDDLLLTQGWRRFVWQPVLAGQLGSFPYLHEQGLSMRGSVVDSRKLRVPGVPVVLTRFHPTGQQQVTSDAEGHFVFADFTSRDSTSVKIEALPMRKVRHPQLLFDTDQPALVTGVPPIPLPLQPNEAGRAARLASVKSMSAGSMAVAGGQGVVLGNVTVHGTKAVKPDNRRIYSRADAVIQTKDIAGITTYRNVIEVLQGRVAGVSVVANQGFVQITMRGTTSVQQMRLSSAPSTTPTSRMRSPTIESSPSPNTNAPLLLLDGVATDITMINSVPLADLETIEVLRTNSAAIYGERAAAGAIAFFTKHANPNYDPASEASVVPPMYVPPRYYQARTFYQPAYSSSTPTPATDQRGATLYWSPNVRTDANGQATVSFYCGDTPGTFLLVLEGLSRTGSPGRGTATLQVTAAK